MPRLRHIFGMLLCILVLGVRRAPAQQAPDQTQDQTQDQGQAQPAQPIPAIRSPLASGADNGSDLYPNPQQLTPDTNSLAGAEDLTLGVEPLGHSYWQPRFDLSGRVTSNALEAGVNSGWTAWTFFTGGVDLHRTTGLQTLFVSYTGGGMFTNNNEVSNGVYQALSISDQFKLRRFALTFIDQFSYAPEASLGAGGFGGIGPSLGLGSSFTLGQTLLTTRGQNVNNSFLTQVDAYLTPRSSLTFVGGYSLLDYFNAGFLNYGDLIFRGGYNYQMTRKDTIALIYQYSGIRYSNFDQSITTNTIQVSYGRRATGKLAFEVAAGPEFAHFQIPISSGATGSGTTTNTSTTQAYWSLNSSLRYRLSRADLGVTYRHGVSGGGGVLAGSVTDTASVSISPQARWSRILTASGTVGYSRNAGLGVAGVASPTTNQDYDYWFVGVNASHPWGRELSVHGSYQLEYQNSNSSFCVGVTCGTSVIVHLFTFGVGWQRRPIPF